MKLVIDCGSTKADLACVDDFGGPVRYRQVKGINVALCATSDDVISYFMLLPWVAEADEVYFYGAGCRPGEVARRTAVAIGMSSRARVIETHSDMLGAARAVLGHTPGVAAILGTGSNTCRYDGKAIIDNIPSLGYVLGDEGSANDLGKRLIRGLFKRQITGLISERFAEAYPEVNVEYLIEQVYRRPGANAWLGQLARFLSSNIDLPEARHIVEESFESFIRLNVLPYGETVFREPIGFVGSVASEFLPQLRAVSERAGLSVGTVLRRPIDGLARYHSGDIDG